jgi:hypothetical protein
MDARTQLKMLVKPLPQDPVLEVEAVSQMSKRTTPPALNLQQYLSTARTCGRRKRKHTELKRSGILERKRLEAEAALLAAREEAARVPLHPPPPWAAGMEVENRVVRVDTIPQADGSVAHEHDTSLFRLRLSAGDDDQSLHVQWWFPPSNPGNAGAWIGLFPADHVVWGANGSPHGEVMPGAQRILYRLLTKNDTSGVSKFTATAIQPKGAPNPLKDGLYVFTLQADYGRYARAVSERFRLESGRVTAIYEGALSSDFPQVNRKHRQQNASLNLFSSVSRSVDKEAEALDERCYFPVTHVDFTLPERYKDAYPYLNRVYALVDKASYLDWGLTSDYQTDGAEAVGDHRLRDRGGLSVPSAKQSAASAHGLKSTQYSELPSAAQHATRKMNESQGSEGYGEATTGSAHKIGLALMQLRDLVLHQLHDAHWGLLWDLGPHSTFLDIGSGYGKVVLHLRLMARMRLAVGMEYVKSRDDIAKQALFSLESEVTAAGGEPPRPASAAAADVAAVASSSDDNASTSSSSAAAASDEPMPDAEGHSTELLPSPPRFVKSGPFDGVEFTCSDATKYDQLSYTHIYIFDWVFSKSTLREIAKVLQRSPFYVLCSFHKVTEWWSYGLVKIQPVAKFPFKTTGNEGMTCWVYANVEKMPSQ